MFWLFARLIAVLQTAIIAIAVLAFVIAPILRSTLTPEMFAPLDVTGLLFTTDHEGEADSGGFFVLLLLMSFISTLILWIMWSAVKSVVLIGSIAKPSLLNSIKETKRSDSIPRFALYLRSFDTQKSQNIFNSGEFGALATMYVPLFLGEYLWPFRLTMDEAIAIGFRSKLPLVGLRSTSQNALEGVVEYQCANEEWRALVHELWDKSAATIIVPGRTAGVLEELVLAHRDVSRRNKTVLIMPPRQGDPLIEIEWDLTQKRAAEQGLQLPKYDRRGRVLNYHGFSAKLGSAAQLHRLVQRALRHAEDASAKGEKSALATG
jgi:hypothetical protein